MAGKVVHNKVVTGLTDNVTPGLKEIRKNFKAFSNSAKRLGKELKGLGTISFAPMAAGLTAGLAAVKSSIGAMVDYGASIDDSSRNLSIAAEALQTFRYAAEQSGSSAGEMDNAIAKLNQNMGNVAQGKNKDLAGLMDYLGISMKDANGHMKTSAELMPEIANALASQTDSTQKAYIATQFFGKSGQNLIKTLSGGAAGLEEFQKEAEHFGIVMSQDDVDAATEFGDSLTRTRYAVQGVQNAIGSKLLPVLQPLLNDFNEWIASNRQWLATTISDSVKDFANSLKDINFKEIIKGAMSFVKASVNLFNSLGGLKTVGIVVGTLFAGKVVSSVVSTSLAFFKLGSAAVALSKVALPALTMGVKSFGIALMTTPVGWICAGLAAVAAAAYLIIDNWDKVKGWLSDFWTWFKDSPLAAMNPLVIFGKFIENHWDTIKECFSKSWDFIKGIWDKFCNLPNAIKEAWADLKEWFSNLFSSIGDSISTGISSVGEKFTSLDGIKSLLPDWMAKGIDYGAKAVDFMAGNNQLSPAGVPLSNVPLTQESHNQIDIRLHTDDKTSAEVERNRSDNGNTKTNVRSINRGSTR